MRSIATFHARAHDTIRPFSSFDTAAPIFFYIVAGPVPLEYRKCLDTIRDGRYVDVQTKSPQSGPVGA